MRKWKVRWKWLAGSALGVAAVGALIIRGVVRAGGQPVYASVTQAPAKPVAIVFGAGVRGAKPSPMLYDRVKTGADLYKAGKVSRLLMTGDNSRADYNEPAVMRRTAIQLGVPARDIVLDYAGFRTYDSLVRAQEVFGVHSATLVSQSYHLPRAIYTARQLGMDVVGVSADHPGGYGGQTLRDFRELLSTESAWFETHGFAGRPRQLAEHIVPLGGGR